MHMRERLADPGEIQPGIWLALAIVQLLCAVGFVVAALVREDPFYYVLSATWVAWCVTTIGRWRRAQALRHAADSN